MTGLEASVAGKTRDKALAAIIERDERFAAHRLDDKDAGLVGTIGSRCGDNHVLGTDTDRHGHAAARFLDQAAWGGDASTIAHVQSVGLVNYLNEQFSAPLSSYPDPTDTAYYLGGVQSRFFSNAVHGQDQLRQRVAFALLNIFVVSAITDNTAPQIIPYLQIQLTGLVIIVLVVVAVAALAWLLVTRARAREAARAIEREKLDATVSGHRDMVMAHTRSVEELAPEARRHREAAKAHAERADALDDRIERERRHAQFHAERATETETEREHI